MRGDNTHVFHWTFMPPSANDRDDDFRAFVCQFLTTNDVIPISLDIKTISIKIGDRSVELDGLIVDTTVVGTGQPLISRVDVYLGFHVMHREVSFQFKLGVFSSNCSLLFC